MAVFFAIVPSQRPTDVSPGGTDFRSVPEADIEHQAQPLLRRLAKLIAL
jgi:hypothetical protein